MTAAGRLWSVAVLAWAMATAAPAGAQLCGDADDNGSITVTDGVTVLRAAAALGTCDLTRCDVDGSGDITVTDGVNVLRAAAGLSATLNCGIL